MEQSRWEKLYLVVVLMILYVRWKSGNLGQFEFVFTILVLGILVQAMIYQVTSYVPKDNNIFFHAFGCAFILLHLERMSWYHLRSTFGILIVLIGLWWSEKYWKYADKVISRVMPMTTADDVVSINTYILQPPECNFYADMSTWVESSLPSFRSIRMPQSTVTGMDRVIGLIGKIRQEKEPRILNMSELTPLAYEADFKLERGPLWFHLGVGMFERELTQFSTRIEDQYYDLVIFEYIPTLNNFYPFAIREKLIEHYTLVDSFEAPRIVYPGTIEVYSSRRLSSSPVAEVQTVR